MRSVAEVAAEHADAIVALPRDGVAVLNADDAHARRVARRGALRAGATVVDVRADARDADVTRATSTLRADGIDARAVDAGRATPTLALARAGRARWRATRSRRRRRRSPPARRSPRSCAGSRRSVRSRDGSRRRARGQRRAS